VGWATVEIKVIREERGIETIAEKLPAFETKINRNFGKIAGTFLLFSNE